MGVLYYLFPVPFPVLSGLLKIPDLHGVATAYNALYVGSILLELKPMWLRTVTNWLPCSIHLQCRDAPS